MTTLAFDTHQFAGQRARPVRADYVGAGEWDSTGIDFADYARMSTQARSRNASRKNETPEWAVNDEKTGIVLVRYIENRAMLGVGTGTMQQRLERARLTLTKLIGNKDATLTNLCKRYVELKDAPTEDPVEKARTLHFWQRDIEGLDTDIRMLQADCPGVILRLMYVYYRLNWDSVGVGATLRLKPPHVRQILWRLNKVAELYWPIARLPKSQCEQIALQLSAGNTLGEIAADMRIPRNAIYSSFTAHGMTLTRLGRGRPAKTSCPQTARRIRRISSLDPTRILYLWNHGESVEQIAERFVGATPGHVRNAIRFAVEERGELCLRPLPEERANGRG